MCVYAFVYLSAGLRLELQLGVGEGLAMAMTGECIVPTIVVCNILYTH